MKCEDVMRSCEKAERYERLSFGVAAHLLYCKKCRENVRNMMSSLYFYHPKVRSYVDKNDALYVRTMSKIFSSKNIAYQASLKRGKRFSIFVLILWCIIGAFSLFAYIFLPATKMGFPFIAAFGSVFKLQFFFILSLFFTTYTIIFIARNIEFLVKTLRVAKRLRTRR